MASSSVVIDEDLYSRQLYVLGADAMKRMAESSVLICGCDGLGVEIAKNVALAGVKSLTLLDHQPASMFDLSTHFYLSEADIGKNRAEVTGPKVAELNPYTPIKVRTEDISSLDLSALTDYAVVCLINAPLERQKEVGRYCHAKGIKFISAESHGCFGSAFVDCGENFEVNDATGEELLEVIIGNISNAVEGVVTCVQGARHGLVNGDIVQFSEVEGMSELNGTAHTIKFVDPYSFKIGDTSSFGTYRKGGLARQQRPVVKLSYKSLEESLQDPEFNFTDFAKFDHPPNLLLALEALHAFKRDRGHFPLPWNVVEKDDFLRQCEKTNASRPEAARIDLNTGLLSAVARTAQGAIVAISAFFGGVVAQEILKAISGKFSPLKQWMFLDCLEVVPSMDGLSEESLALNRPRGDRYDAQRIVIGHEAQQKVLDGKLFMIGCGAIGCEMLKNYAMMGFGAGAGLITCTDNDLIEKSNLNRQFLFRSKDISSPKSQAASRAVKALNPHLRVEAHTHKVAAESESTYTDEFFSAQDVIVNALDNVEARIYVDKRCVENGRPLMESGTMGTKGHVQNILPDLTANYSMSQDPPEAGFPFCTLKSFPYKIEHTIQWARDKFQTNFTLKPNETMQFLRDCKAEGYWQRLRASSPSKPDIVRAVRLLSQNPTSFEECVRLSVNKFTSYFRNSVMQLLHNFPPEHVEKDGKLFWSPPRRVPTPFVFDPTNGAHLQFVYHSACLYANVFQLKDPVPDIAQVAKIASTVVVPPFKPKEDKHIEADESAKAEEVAAKKREKETYREGEFDELLAKMEALARQPRAQVPEDFEKDVDSNHHIDYITAASNLRSMQYGLEPADRLRTKRIAGRIIPAMATSTAAVSGLVSLEMIKVLLGMKNLVSYKNAWVNLALPMVMLSEPQECPRTKITDDLTISLWTKRWIVPKGGLALGQFLNHFKKTYKLSVTGIFHNVNMIYGEIFPDHKKRIPLRLEKLLGDLPPGAQFVDLTCSFETLDGKDVTGPTVRYYLKH